jgi:hypothetical protein
MCNTIKMGSSTIKELPFPKLLILVLSRHSSLLQIRTLLYRSSPD